MKKSIQEYLMDNYKNQAYGMNVDDKDDPIAKDVIKDIVSEYGISEDDAKDEIKAWQDYEIEDD